jgi:hypothetical protein
MRCQLCGYIMSDLDEECKRCHGKGATTFPNPQVNTPVTLPPVQSTAPVSAQSASDVAPSQSTGGLNAMQLAGAALLLLGGLAAFYFFFIFDTTVEVPSTEFMGTEIGGGRIMNIGLMADRQNGIMLSIGSAVVGSILFALGHLQGGKAVISSKASLRLFVSATIFVFAACVGAVVIKGAPVISAASARITSENRLKMLALAIKRSQNEHDVKEGALMPTMTSPEAMQADLKPFLNKDSVGGEEIFFEAFTGEPFQPNPWLSKKDDYLLIPDDYKRAWTVMVYEKSPSDNHTRVCAFVDGHVKRISESDWPTLKTSSNIP